LVADAAAFERARRPKPSKLAAKPELRDVVADKLDDDWSPQQIAQWLRREFGGDAAMRISHESIYRDLYMPSRKVFDPSMFHCLRSKRSIRRPRGKKRSHGRGQIRNMVSIRERPTEADTRQVAGHWEGDLVFGARPSAMATLVDRATRYAMVAALFWLDPPRCNAREVSPLPHVARRRLGVREGIGARPHRTWESLTLRVCRQPEVGGIANGGSIAQKVHRVTYCIGVMLDKGMIFASDSRTHAGVDNFAKFCKMTVFERRGNRVIVLLSSGNLAGTQAVISVLTQRCADGDAATNLMGAQTMFDVVRLVSDATRDIENRDAGYLEDNNIRFDASFIVGGQISGEPIRLFRTYAEGNFIEAGTDTPFFQTGETKYGKPILDRVLTQHTPLADATKCVLVSFDSTMRSNLSVGMPIDLICYERDSLEVQWRRRFDVGDPYFTALSDEWGEGVRQVFRHLPELQW
jgi:putative proteasome-type protease